MSDPTLSLTLTQFANVTPEHVWAILTDLDNAADRLRGIDAIERIGGPDGYEVGTTWRETRTMMGKSADEVMEVLEVEEPRRTVVGADAHGMTYRTTFTLSQREGGTDITMQFAGSMTKKPGVAMALLMKLTNRLGLAMTRKAMVADLEDIAAAAEERAGSAS